MPGWVISKEVQNAMKKGLLFILSIALIFSAGTGAKAEMPLTAICDSADVLLFKTSNVTITGEAVFSMDGERFKTAGIKYIQDGDRSLWELKLSSPRADGRERENGYTVIADGSRIYVMEVYRPGVYKTGTATPQSTLLRKSIQLDLLRDLVRMVAAQMEIPADNNAVTIEENREGSDIRIIAEEDVTPIVNMTLNLLAQYCARRYFHMDYDQISELQMIPMSAYLTVTESIIACTKFIALKHADINIQKDQNGQPENISGDVSILLNTAKDGEHTVNITFLAEISDRGESHVGTFSPAEYNVRLAEGAMEIENIMYSEVDEYTQEKLIEQAKTVWEQTGFKLDDSTYGYAYKQNGRYCTELVDNANNLTLSCVTNVAGKVLELRHASSRWQDRDFNYESIYPDEQMTEDAARKVMEYLARINPDDMKRIDRLRLQCWLEEDEELYLEFCEDPIAQDWDGILVVVRVRPEWQIEYYSCFSNG